MINKLEKSRTAVTVTPSRTPEEAEAELLITPLSGRRPALPGYKLKETNKQTF